ncbi:hypothetical protein [Vulgatibacter incomptus]|uniref:hypothetical protein n=1 Tax=Vulgatibacter incomptus TaxID=1391653 RepID=UPI0012F8C72F|nr:hypothetical protein [Vulgatibacter incomptus]
MTTRTQTEVAQAAKSGREGAVTPEPAEEEPARVAAQVRAAVQGEALAGAQATPGPEARAAAEGTTSPR